MLQQPQDGAAVRAVGRRRVVVAAAQGEARPEQDAGPVAFQNIAGVRQKITYDL